jgi:tRNA A37 methylthiotransferase MiaB
MNESMPEVEVHTHFLVGFPGETRSDFLDSMRLIQDFKFKKIDVFCYQDRPGTKASLLSNKLSRKVKIKRAQELSSLGNYIDLNY